MSGRIVLSTPSVTNRERYQVEAEIKPKRQPGIMVDEAGMDQLRVCMVSTPDDGSCGIGTYTGTLTRALEDRSDALVVERVTLRLRSLNPFHLAWAAVRAGISDVDLIHVQHEYGIYGQKSLTSWVFFPVLYLITSLRRIPVMITLHSAWNKETLNPPLKTLKRIYVKANNLMLVLSTDFLVFLSEIAKDRFAESVAFSESTVLPHGVQTDVLPMDKSTAKAEFGFEDAATVIVEPGYVRREKGQDRFVDIARGLPQYSFLIAGGTQAAEDEPYLREVRRMAPENVQLTGVLDDYRFHAAFQAADLVLLPYRTVTQSGIFNWCVAYEVPVLASESEYFGRLREEWGCVELFDPTNVGEAARTVEMVAEDEERRRTLQKSMREYQTRSSMEAVAESHLNLYQLVANHAGS